MRSDDETGIGEGASAGGGNGGGECGTVAQHVAGRRLRDGSKGYFFACREVDECPAVMLLSCRYGDISADASLQHTLAKRAADAGCGVELKSELAGCGIGEGGIEVRCVAVGSAGAVSLVATWFIVCVFRSKAVARARPVKV